MASNTTAASAAAAVPADGGNMKTTKKGDDAVLALQQRLDLISSSCRDTPALASHRPLFGPPPPPSTLSTLPTLTAQYQQAALRLDALHHLLSTTVTSKRRRVQSQLLTSSTTEGPGQHRRTHLRLFLTHHVQTIEEVVTIGGGPAPTTVSGSGASVSGGPIRGKTLTKKKRRWTLVLEGHPLIGPLDHLSANAFDERVEREHRDKIEQMKGRHGNNVATGAAREVQSSEEAQREAATTGSSAGHGGHSTTSATMQRKRERSVGYADPEELMMMGKKNAGEEPLQFAHYFDSVRCTFCTVREKARMVTMRGRGRGSGGVGVGVGGVGSSGGAGGAPSASTHDASTSSSSAAAAAAPEITAPSSFAAAATAASSNPYRAAKSRRQQLLEERAAQEAAAERARKEKERREKLKKDKARQEAAEKAAAMAVVESVDDLDFGGEVTTLEWNREEEEDEDNNKKKQAVTDDSKAFHLTYTDLPTGGLTEANTLPDSRDGDRVIAVVTLQRRSGEEYRYVPSKKLARALFPAFLHDLDRIDWLIDEPWEHTDEAKDAAKAAERAKREAEEAERKRIQEEEEARRKAEAEAEAVRKRLADEKARKKAEREAKKAAKKAAREAQKAAKEAKKAANAAATPKGRKRGDSSGVATRKTRCGQCEACTRKDCGMCKYCLDKPKFGGTHRMKKPCELRTCTNPIIKTVGGPSPSASFPAGGEDDASSAAVSVAPSVASPMVAPLPNADAVAAALAPAAPAADFAAAPFVPDADITMADATTTAPESEPVAAPAAETTTAKKGKKGKKDAPKKKKKVSKIKISAKKVKAVSSRGPSPVNAEEEAKALAAAQEEKKKQEEERKKQEKAKLREEKLRAMDPYYPPFDNDINIAPTLTRSEVLKAIFLYIKDNALQDLSDLSTINNDEKLADLFGCERMQFGDVASLLISKKLIFNANPSNPNDRKAEAPIKLVYIMSVDGADVHSMTDLEDPPALDEDYAPSMISCDIDVNVPGLFHERARELLRRIKKREYEYNSTRNRAHKALLPSGSNKVDEEIVKKKMEEVISDSGQGLSASHLPVLLALAREAPEGSEVALQAAADARMVDIMERIEQKVQTAQACWDIVDACKGS